ncbi:MAG: hypothetical protein ABIZ72_10655, partial [Candidatus Limnocylindrales bacterium]
IAIVDGGRLADLVLVNTSTVTAEADATSHHAVRRVRRARRASPDAAIVVTGINTGTYDGGRSERGFRGAHGRSALAGVDPDRRDRLVGRILSVSPRPEPSP